MRPISYILWAKLLFTVNYAIFWYQLGALVFFSIPMNTIVVFGTFVFVGMSKYLNYLLFEKYQVTAADLMGE